jgi:hypothetical protein
MRRGATIGAGLALLVALCAGAAFASVDLAGGTLSTREASADPPPSSDPYTASLRYARCMRQHGVPHPDPDRRGDFNLTPADEKRMRAVPLKIRKRADDACFHHLKGLNLKPLSPHAIALATKVVEELGSCLRSYGHRIGKAEVRNLGRGRASFGFRPAAGARSATDRTYWQSAAGRREATLLERHQAICEKRVRLAPRLTKIINDDRRAIDDL